MELTKIYESLGIDKLDEKKQTEIKLQLDETVELKAKEISLTKIEEQKETIIEEYEGKFESYKTDITSKFSSFIDDILEQEMSIPQHVMDFAHKGEMYEPIIEMFKTKLSIDEGTLTDEVKELMKDAKDEIQILKDKLNTITSEKIELKEDCQKMAVDIYLRKKCDGLQEAKKIKIMSLLEGIEDTDEVDRKFDILTDQISSKINEEEMKCKECGAKVDVSDDEDDKTCPECGGELVKSGKEEKKDDKDDKDKKKGKEELKEDFIPKPVGNIMESWVKTLKDGRI